MKTKSGTIIAIAIALLALTTANSAHGAAVAAFYLRTDRASYLPGDSGMLFVTIRNEGDQAMTIKNLTITYPWKAFINDHWEGNSTVSGINQAVAIGAAYNNQFGFTVPGDGRGRTGSISVQAGTDIGGGGGSYRFSSTTIFIATATYEPVGFSASSILPIINTVLLAVACVILALLLIRTGVMSKKP